MARPIDADPNEDFDCIYCGKDVNANRDPGGYYLYCDSECEGLFESGNVSEDINILEKLNK